VLDLIILSPCFYENTAPADLMVKSAEANGLTVQLYGVGQPFIPHGADAQVQKLADLMRPTKLSDYVLVTDCRDVLFLTDAIEILGKFKACGASLVMSTEQGCWPPDREITEFYYGKDPNGYNYINAGQYLGEWTYVRECLAFLLVNYRGSHPGADNSQGWWMWAKMRGELDFVLDSQCQIFQSMSGGSDGQVRVAGKRVANLVTGTFPCSVHYNGNQDTTAYNEMYRRLYDRP